MTFPRAEAAAEISVDGKLLSVYSPPAARALIFGPGRHEPVAVVRPRQTKVVLLGSAHLRHQEELFAGAGKLIVFASAPLSPAARRWLAARGELHGMEPSGLRGILSLLGARFGRIAWGGGTSLLRALAREGLLARLDITFRPEIRGGASAPTLLGPATKGVLPRSVPLRFEGAGVRRGALRVAFALAERRWPPLRTPRRCANLRIGSCA